MSARPQVLSPLSRSILAEKTVTVLDDKVAVSDLAIQLMRLGCPVHLPAWRTAGLSWLCTAEELLQAPKQSKGSLPDLAKGMKRAEVNQPFQEEVMLAV